MTLIVTTLTGKLLIAENDEICLLLSHNNLYYKVIQNETLGTNLPDNPGSGERESFSSFEMEVN